MSLLPVFDKYAPYIWSAYGLTALILVGLALWLWLEARRAARLLAELEAARAAPSAQTPPGAALRPSSSAARLREAPAGEAS